MSSIAFAQDDAKVNDLKNKIDNRKDSLGQLNDEISKLKTQIDSIGKQKKSLQNELRTIELNRQRIAKEAEITRIKAQRTNAAIQTLDKSIKDKQSAIQRQRLAVSNALQKIAENDHKSLVEVLLASASLSDAYSETDQMSQLQGNFIDEMNALRGLTKELGTDKQSQEKAYQEAQDYSRELGDKKALVDGQRNQHNQLIKETSNKESEFQAQLKEKEKRKRQFELELQAFESELKVAVDETSFPKSGTKVFASPLNNMRITQHFGYTAAAKTLYATGKHTGTDFAAQVGTAVKTVLSGTVVATGDTDIACRGASYGKYIYIVHKNGLSTLYGHMSRVSVSPGQAVSTGSVIGYSGNTGYSTGPHLHLGVFVASATKISDVPSQACPGAIFHMPVAPKEAYLDFENYF